MSINKNEVLELTNNGLDIYKNWIPELKVIGDKCENTLNPLYDDTNKGLSIYYKNGRWNHHDFGEPDYSGDCFSFAAAVYGLTNSDQFYQVLMKLYNDLKLNDKDPFLNGQVSSEVLPKRTSIEKSDKYFKLYFRENKNELDEREINYFNQYNISRWTLLNYRVYCIDGYEYTDSDGFIKRITRGKDQIMIAYCESSEYAKIYIPEPKSFRYLGNKPEDYSFGGLGHYACGKEGEGGDIDVNILTGGEKDLLTLHELGYNAYCLNSESANIQASILKEYRSKYNFVLYDNDETGKKMSKKVAEKYGYTEIHLPASEKYKGCKDISDYVVAGFTWDEFENVINSLREEIDKINSKDDDDGLDGAVEQDIIDNLTQKFLPEEIFAKLPPLLKNICGFGNDTIERNLALLGSIGVISGCLPNYKTVYDRRTYYPNLFLMVVAPPASGKSALTWAKDIGQVVHEKMKSDSEEAMKEYKKEMAIYNKKEGDKGPEPIKPNYQILFMPANISSSGFYKLLNDSGGNGIIFETEIDTLNNSLKNDWGNYSELLRKAAHHEPATLYRKGGEEHIEIEKPKLSVVMTGTPNQIKKLIPDRENGLLSRVAFFEFETPKVWKNVFLGSSKSLDDELHKIGIRVKTMHDTLSNRSTDVIYGLSKMQEDRFNSYFGQSLSNFRENTGDDGLSSYYRLGLFIHRVSMILSILRYENKDIPDYINCTNEDFEVALSMATMFKNHTATVLKLIPKTSSSLFKNDNQKTYFNSLPSGDFKKTDGIQVAIKMKIPEKTAENYLVDLADKNLLKRPKHGWYNKLLKT